MGERETEKKGKKTNKSFYRICASSRGTKIWRNRESLKYNICLNRLGTVSTNSDLRIAYKTRITR
jgi:hypothetical protein